MKWWGRSRARVQRASLFTSVTAVVLSGLLIALAAWFVLWVFLGAKAETPNQLDLTKVALSMAAGVGGAVALVVGYRRQRDVEQRRFADLFGAAAKQLGDPDVAVRIAGVFAMAGVADEAGPTPRRQQCVDVLCGYLRLPYQPEDGGNHLVSRTLTTQDDGTTTERKFQYRQNDKEVRQTIVRVIASHLKSDSAVSWGNCNFWFDGAVLEAPDFRSVVFRGPNVSFLRTTFVGRAANFRDAKFLGGHTTFREARLEAGAWFRDAEFRSDRLTFDDAVFAGAHTSFDWADITGKQCTFTGTSFRSGEITFSGARFGSEVTVLRGAAFSGNLISFDAAEFDGLVSFEGADFDCDICSFNDSRFRGAYVSFSMAAFRSRYTTFRDARFRCESVDFDGPRAWTGMHFDWDRNPAAKPDLVKPKDWPPTPAPD